jgi:hypothetical protein
LYAGTKTLVIYGSAWKVDTATLAMTEFWEVRAWKEGTREGTT